MLIEASVRPRNMKRGVKIERLAEALKTEPSLSKMVGRMDLSAEKPFEFAFLRELYRAFCPIGTEPTKITIEIAGKTTCTYVQPGSSQEGR